MTVFDLVKSRTERIHFNLRRTFRVCSLLGQESNINCTKANRTHTGLTGPRVHSSLQDLSSF